MINCSFSIDLDLEFVEFVHLTEKKLTVEMSYKLLHNKFS